MHSAALRRAGAGIAAAGTILVAAYAAAQAPAHVIKVTADTFAPRLRVEATRVGAVPPSLMTIEATQTPTQPELARMSVVIPSGYILQTVKHGRRFAHATVGVVSPGAKSHLPALLLNGDLLAVATKGNSCVAKPTAVYRGVLASSPGGTAHAHMTLTVFLEKVGKSMRYTLCLPKTAPAPGAIRRVTLSVLSGILPPGPGHPMWRGLFTPFAASASAAKAATTESQSTVPLPSFLTIAASKATVKPNAAFRLLGQLSLNGPSGNHSIQVSFAAGPGDDQYVGTTTTKGAAGSYSISIKAPAKAGLYFYTARAPSKGIPCKPASAEAPAGCTSATLAGITSPYVKVTVKA
jgi:hypothetical protein